MDYRFIVHNQLEKEKKNQGDDQEPPKVFLEQWETTMGASTCMFRQLNSRANTGFDNITETQRFSPFSMVSTAVESMELKIWSLGDPSFSFFGPGEGLDTLAGFTALTLYENSFKKHIVTLFKIKCIFFPDMSSVLQNFLSCSQSHPMCAFKFSVGVLRIQQF